MSDIYDVIIVGAGPVGDSLALLLASYGVKALIADKSPEIYPLPRAAHIDHEIVRVFQQLGVADAVMAASRSGDRYDFLNADGKLLLRFQNGATPSGWPANNMIHQPSVEAILRGRFADFPQIDLRTSWELSAFADDGTGVTATFQTPEGQQVVRGRFMVGCDGACSSVRERLQVSLEDLQFDEPWLVIDTLVHDVTRLPKVNLQICNPARPTTCVLMGSGRHRWEFMLKPEETPEIALDDEFIETLLKPWNVSGAVSLERKAVYRFHALIANQWRVGNVFLAGDAAHQTPPFAGQGLCAGVRDAANLAWKIAAVLHGSAEGALLDTYMSERRPHVKSYIELALMMGRTVCILDPAAAAARDEAMLARRAAAGDESDGGQFMPGPFSAGCVLSGSKGAGQYFPQPCDGALKFDDIAGAGPVLLTRDTAPVVSGVKPLSLSDPVLAPLAGRLSSWLESRGADAVLVRPDRYVFGTGKAGKLAEQWHNWLH